MNTPNWMMDAPAHASQRAKLDRGHNRRSTDRQPLNRGVLLGLGSALIAAFVVFELTSLLLK